MSVAMKVNQHVVLTAHPTLSSQPAPVSSTPIWSIDDPSLASLIPDGLTVTVQANNTPGIAVVSVSAVGQGAVVLNASFTISITADYASAMDITASAPY